MFPLQRSDNCSGGDQCTGECVGRSQYPRGRRHGSAAARLLLLWVRIPPAGHEYLCCVCCIRAVVWNVSNIKMGRGRI
jgi:hypothetical protein